MSVSLKSWNVQKRTALRHALGAVLLIAAWNILQTWYTFQHPHQYLIFAAFALSGFLVGCGPFLYREIRNLPRFRVLACLPIFVLCLPWGEWLGLGTIFTRESWSEKLFLQGIFIYVSVAVLRILPTLATLIRTNFLKVLETFSFHPSVALLPAIFLFLLTSSIALFVYRETPIVQDSATHIFQARVFSRFKLYAPAPPVAEAFTGPMDLLVMRNGKWFGFSFPAFAALLAPATWVNLEWLVSPLIAALTAAIWISYAWRWHGKLIAVLIGWLLLLSPFIVVMSSTIMVFTPELFFASAVIFFSRLSLEKTSILSSTSLLLATAGAILVRPFSVLTFLSPIVAYTSLQSFKRKQYGIFCSILLGLLLGIAAVLVFQWKTIGNPFLSGYRVEAPELNWGFSAKQWDAYPPISAIGNVSNNLLGLNEWLGGWYSGSILFISIFFLKNRIQTWDKLLLSCCGILMLFYFFYYVQDLFFGPRFYYLFAPILLLFVARSIFPSQPEFSSGKNILIPFFVLTVALSVPNRLPSFVTRYNPSNSQAGQLKQEIVNNGQRKTLVFLDKSVGQNFVNWNDPFLKTPVIICRDIGVGNLELKKHFSEYRPVWFRMNLSFEKGKITNKFKFNDQPDRTPEGKLSLFNLAMALQAPRNYRKRDFFDICYVDLFNAEDSTGTYEFLENESKKTLRGREYKQMFRRGIIHAGKMLLLPKIAFEKGENNWAVILQTDRFRQEFDDARESFVEAGDVGVPILKEMEKVQKRIDRNSDSYLSDLEIQLFLREKIKLLIRGGSL